jgi:hypothetical protein
MRQPLFALCLLISACAGGTPEAKESPRGVGLEVVTIDQGAEPRGPLRYMGQPGETQRLQLRLSLSAFVATTVAFAEADLPVVNLVAVIGESFRGGAAGLLGYPISFEQIRIEGGAIDDATRAALMTELAALTESSAVFEIDDRGITRKATATVAPNVSPRLLGLLGNIRTTLLAAALPVEDVGLGARWEVDRIMDVGGMKVPQKVTYTLLARDSEQLRIGVTVRQSATAQTFTLGAHGKIAVEAYEVSVVGSTLVDLRHFAPIGEMHGISQMRATVQHGSATETVNVNSDLMIDLDPLPNAPAQGAAQNPATPAPTPAPAAAL